MPTKNIHDLDDTWNNGATEFTAIKMDVTDTASAAGSKLIDLQVGGVSKFKVDKDGNLTLDGDITSNARVYYSSGGTDVPVADGGTGASTAAAARTNLSVGTGDSPQFAGVNIGHATDTTVTRASAGQINVEGVQVATASNTLTLTNKTLTTPTINGAALSGSFSGTPNFTNVATFASNISAANYILSNNNPSSAGTVGFTTADGPGIQFWGASTGGAGSLRLLTAGSNRITVTSAGNVGIGTASPNSPLTINTGTASFDSVSANSQTISIGNFAGSGISAPAIAGRAEAMTGLTLISRTVDGNTAGDMRFDARASSGSFATTANVAFRFTNNGVAALAIRRSGNAGVGTESPSAKLHVDGPIRHLTYTVATLPAAGTVGAGTRAAVTDANATTFNSIVAAGGANFVPVISNGTNWLIG